MKYTRSLHFNCFIVIFAFIFISVSLYGCSVPASNNNNTKIEHDIDLEKNHEGVTFHKKYIDNIPVLDVFNDDGNKKPVVFILHGYSGNKYYSVDLAVRYARSGYYAVIFDAYGHGERSGGTLKSFPEVMAMYPYDIEKIVNSLKDSTQADIYNMGMLGISMGACAIYKYCTFGEIKPKVITPLVGTPYYEQFMNTELSRSVYDEKTGNHQTPLSQEKLNTILAESSAFKDYMELKNINILMQQGSNDTLVTAEGANMLYHVLKGVGAENVNLISHEGMTHHNLYDVCFDNAIKFMDKHLKK